MFHRVLELFVISLKTNTTSSFGLKKQQNAISISKKKKILTSFTSTFY